MLSIDYSPSGTGHSSMGPPQAHRFCQQTCMGSSPQDTGPASSLLCGVFMGCNFHEGISACSCMGFPQAAELTFALPWTAGEQPASQWSPPQTTQESLIWHLDHLITSFLHRRYSLQDCFSHVFLTLSSRSCCAALFSFS